MRYLFTFLCLVLLTSCDDTDLSIDGNGTLATITFNITSTSNDNNGRIKTVFLESGFFKYDNTTTTNVFPYKKSYTGEINFAANLAFEYEDKATDNFSIYTITMEIFRDNVLVDKREYFIDKPGINVGFDAVVNK
ncbi:hypothetical protein [Tenacibaculum discolor]|uniref:hypothetical protein n=1 Tax=Tenacibaculum discolor TaxID=361581 RepID=UPI000EB58760|nr:hypothetical protein [Tenacibaculum discolor]RLK00328.1 hypothetical protein C8N27_2015 [Tenacibaculum discolor]